MIQRGPSRREDRGFSPPLGNVEMKTMITFVVIYAVLSALVAAKSMSIAAIGHLPASLANYTGDAVVDRDARTRTSGTPAKRTISALYFVNKVVNDDMFQAETSPLVEQNGDQIDKTFARRMVAKQRKATNELKSLVDGGMLSLQMPTALDNGHREMLAELKPLKGRAFDEAYDKGQLSRQRDIVALFEQYASNGKHADLRQWAIQMLPHLYETLRMTEGLSHLALGLHAEKDSS
jgi:putative membrane protein